MPQKLCGGYILHVTTYAFFRECPKIGDIHFRFFSRFKIGHVLFSSKCPTFYVRNSRNALIPFPNQMGKWGISVISNIKKWGMSRKKHVPKMNKSDFGAFQGKMHMPSRAKFILHILFRAFHGTPRIVNFLDPNFQWLIENHSNTKSWCLYFLNLISFSWKTIKEKYYRENDLNWSKDDRKPDIWSQILGYHIHRLKDYLGTRLWILSSRLQERI